MSDPNTVTTTPSALQPPARLRGVIRAAATGALALAVIAALLLAFAWPWVAPIGEGAPLYSAPPLSRYAPLRDGAASLTLVTDAAGKPTAWRSSNVRVLLGARAVTTDLRPSFRDAISQIYSARAQHDVGDANLPDLLAQYGANIYQVLMRTLDTSGRVTETVSIGVRDEEGDHFVGMYDAAHNIELLYDPPLYTPPDLTPGRVWTSSGQVVGLDYQAHSRALEAEVSDSTPGHFDDCLNVETTFVLSVGDETLSTSTSQDRYCAGVGVVESRQSENGTLTGRNETLSNQSGAVDLLPASPPLMPRAGSGAADVTPAGDPRDGTWQLTHWSQALLSDEVGESTIPPQWIPGDPAMVLAAASGGDLIAFDASDDTSVVLWRFHPGGAVYSPPAYDRGRIFFGASDKRLYALDTRGLFLWSYETGDNIATRPVVVSDTVLFGSEDRNIYALDAP
ncbi:MAG: PQQ-binding-like beta-propeller repeat protein, partial [Chloroflexi bacterium]|nr:PQQ-binding-like beta-propeller repeat protein [Chloroflexota bacterium]